VCAADSVARDKLTAIALKPLSDSTPDGLLGVIVGNSASNWNDEAVRREAGWQSAGPSRHFLWRGLVRRPGGDTSSVDSRALKQPQSRNPRDQ
jgi:hypothetical protein